MPIFIASLKRIEKYRISFSVCLICLVAIACGDIASLGSESTDYTPTYDELVGHLRDVEFRVIELGEVLEPCFRVRPKALLVEGGTVELFQYTDSSEAEKDIGRLTPGRFLMDLDATGLNEGTDVSWFHFYRKGSLMVLYIGFDSSVGQTLESMLGPEVASGASGLQC